MNRSLPSLAAVHRGPPAEEQTQRGPGFLPVPGQHLFAGRQPHAGVQVRVLCARRCVALPACGHACALPTF